jgi:Icc-related predicted phosphoesterase
LKVVAISDTHSYHRKVVIPEADVLVHAGDVTFRGELAIVEDFANWLKELPIKQKIVIFGNHEIGFQHGPKRAPAIKLLQDAGVIYLESSEVVIDGIKFYGDPHQPWFHDWEWNLPRGKALADKWKLIPNDTNVLITHGPPFGIMDQAPRMNAVGYENVGCQDLFNRLSDLDKLQAHVFGHIHEGYGSRQIGPCLFVNAAVCTGNYNPSNPPIVFEVFNESKA